MRRERSRWSLAIALLLVTILVAGCGLGEQDPADVELEVVPVERGSLTSSISAVGTVRAGAEIVLSFETAGRVRLLAVQEGARVDEGQLLAQLDQADLALQVRSAQAALASAQAQLDSLREGPRPEEVSAAEAQVAAAQAALDQATAQLDQLQGGATEAEIAAAQAAVNSARANYNRVRAGPSAEEQAQAQAVLDSAEAGLLQAQAAFDRVAGREDVGMLPESLALQNATIEKQRAQANYDALLSHPTAAELAAAQAQLAQAEAHLAQLEAGVEPQLRVAEAAVDAARAQRDIAQAQLNLLRGGAGKAEIAVAEAQVEQAQVAVDSARLAAKRADLEAPLEGTIASITIDIGESVSPQMPAMTLVRDSQFTIEADVDEADIGWIEIGQAVKITFDAFPGREMAGQVLAIAPLASVDLGIVSYRVTIESKTTDLPLRAGMTANTEIVKERREDVLLVPNLAIALDPESGLKYVDLRTATGLERVAIETGLTTDTYSEVRSGLEEGDMVVISSLSDRDQFRQLMDSTFSGGSRE
jgi:HlyD family secretion protein